MEAVILLELIFQGFFEWVYGLILECWEYFFSSMLDIMSMDFAYIKTHIPVIGDITQVFLAVGWALLLGNLVFQAVRSMASGFGFEGEDPKLLFARTFAFSFLLLASPQICEIGLNLTSKIITLLEIPDVIDVHLADSSLFGTLSAAWLLVIICDIIIMFKVLKLLLEAAERHVILAVLSITAPLAFSMGGSKSTTEIFTGWCRMFGSMCLLMVTNVMFFKMLLSVVSTIPSGLDVFPWMVLIITIVKVAKKADEIITRIGLNPAITGDRSKGMGTILAYTVLRTAASQVVKTVGAAATAGGTVAAGAAVETAGAAGTAGTAGAAGAAFRPGKQWDTAQPFSSPQEQASGPSPQGGAGSSGQAASGNGAFRKTSVPKGTRRSASHITGSNTGTPEARKKPSGGFGDAGRGTIRHSGKVGGKTAPQHAVDVFVGDDFDDSDRQAGKGGGAKVAGVSAKVTSTGGSGISKGAGKHSPDPSAKQSRSRQAGGGAGKGGGSGPTETRSTKRNKMPPMPTAQRQGGTERSASTQAASIHTSSQKVSSAQTVSDTKQRSSSTVRSGTVRQEIKTATTSAGTVLKRSASTPHPNPAGTGASTAAQEAVRQRSIKPVRQETGEAAATSEAPGKGGASTVRPSLVGTAVGTQTRSVSKERSPCPARQGQAFSVFGETVQKGGAPIVHPGPAGTDGITTETLARSGHQTSNPVRQDRRQTSIPDGPPLKGGSPVARPGTAETSTLKGQPPSKRQGRATQRKPDQGGPEHGKPRP